MISTNIKEISDITFVEPTNEEISILNEIVDEDFKQNSEMSDNDRAFLNSTVRKKRPLKCLELGVSRGASSIIILNAIKDIAGAHLYSIDYNENHYRLKDKKTGFYVDNYPELKKQWTLKTGGLALNFLDEIGGEIDFCLIDTVHSNPGEILDFLMVLPFLKKDAIVCFHDTNLHLAKIIPFADKSMQFTNSLLMSAIRGEKIIPSYKKPYEVDFFTNIGGIQLTEETSRHLYEIFNLLSIKWAYFPNDTDLNQCKEFFARFYPDYYLEYFDKIIAKQKELHELRKDSKRLKIPLFSVKNHRRSNGKEHKVIQACGIKIKIKTRDAYK